MKLEVLGDRLVLRKVSRVPFAQRRRESGHGTFFAAQTALAASSG